MEEDLVSYCRCGLAYTNGYSDNRSDECFCSKKCADDYQEGDI